MHLTRDSNPSFPIFLHLFTFSSHKNSLSYPLKSISKHSNFFNFATNSSQKLFIKSPVNPVSWSWDLNIRPEYLFYSFIKYLEKSTLSPVRSCKFSPICFPRPIIPFSVTCSHLIFLSD